jgi:hypothetical protein
MNKKQSKLKAGAFAVVTLFFVMTAASTVNATSLDQLLARGQNGVIPIMPGISGQCIGQRILCQQIDGGAIPVPPQNTYTVASLGNGATSFLGPATDPNGQDEPFPPPGQRCSHMYLTGVYDMYNGSLKLVGLSFNIWMNARGGTHTANWYPANVCLTLEGDHAGTYYYPNFYWFNTFSGSPGWWGLSIQDTWNPAHDRITYFHIWADYTEDGQHIRYVDRTLTETWNNNNG